MIRISFSILVAGALLVGTVGCSSESETPSSSSQSGENTAKEGEVVWPALSNLDDLSHRISAALENDDLESARGLVDETIKTMKEVAESETPKNVRRRVETITLQNDLSSLIDSLETAESEEEITQTLQAVPSVTHSLMQSAGVPHKHGGDHSGEDHGDDSHSHDHSHDSETHSHDHDHEGDHDHSHDDHEGHDH